MARNMPPVEEEEYYEDEPQELPAGEPETTGEKIIAHTPWWAISVGMHAFMALIVGWLWVFSLLAEDEAVIVRPPRRLPPPPEMVEPPEVNTENNALDIEKTVEVPIYRKDVTEADHNETDDNEEFEKAQGDSLDFVSDKPFQGKGTYDVIGGGGGGGGRYGGRRGGKMNLVKNGGGGKGTEDAVLAALKWLARHQGPDGAWSIQHYVGGVVALMLAIGLAVGISGAFSLNLLSLGDETATHLGVDVARLRRRILLATALMIGASVAVSGLIGFVGLVVPHLLRLVVGADHRVLVPASALLGAALLLLADTLARTLLAPTELPVGALTALVGGPVFLVMLRRELRHLRA